MADEGSTLDPATVIIVAGLIAQLTRAGLDYARARNATPEQMQEIIDMITAAAAGHVALSHEAWATRAKADPSATQETFRDSEDSTAKDGA